MPVNLPDLRNAVNRPGAHLDTAAEFVMWAFGMEPGRRRPGSEARWPRLQPSPANLLLVRVFFAAVARCTRDGSSPDLPLPWIQCILHPKKNGIHL